MWWNIWVTKYCLDPEIEILDIYPFIALIGALETQYWEPYYIWDIWSWNTNIISQNAIKGFIIPGQYNKENVYWADLFTHVKSCNKEIGMNIIYFPIFKFWGYIFAKYQ